jgi:hypothetical protein
MICLLTFLFNIPKTNYDVSMSKDTNKANRYAKKKDKTRQRVHVDYFTTVLCANI